jgi:hypothetical protein
VEPETRYARSGDVSIAYQVIGEGPFDVVRVPPFVSHVELEWEVPMIAEFARRLSSFCRLIPGEVVVSSTVKDLVAGSGIEFRERGAVELKGVPGEWRLFAVER